MKIYGILAHPAKHSLSPPIHNAAFKALNISAYYDRFDISPEELEDFMLGAKDELISGFSVSVPHKQAVIKYMDDLSDDAGAMGAVNTIKNVNGKFEGHNFDWIGAVRALEEITSLNGKKCLVLGAGGAARATVYGLKKNGANVTILNRTAYKAEELAKEFGCEFGSLDDVRNFEADIIVQTTSCWLHDLSVQLIPTDYYKPEMLVMDIVYSPLMTPLLKDAKEAGCTTVTGDKMLLYQAYEQFKLWTAKEAPKEVMEARLKQVLNSL